MVAVDGTEDGMVVAGTEDGAAPAGVSTVPLTPMVPVLIMAAATKCVGFPRRTGCAGGGCGSAVSVDTRMESVDG